MEPPKFNKVFKKILVALDASPNALAALELAAEWACRMGAELEGVFVEEQDWFVYGKHPFMKEVMDFTGTISTFTEEHVEREIQLLTHRIHTVFEQKCRIMETPFRFKTYRGLVTDKIKEAAKDADLIIIGRVGYSALWKKSIGRTTQEIIRAVDKPVLIYQKGISTGSYILVLIEDSEIGRQVLNTALILARYLNKKLQFFVYPDAEDAHSIADRVKKGASQAGIVCQIKILRNSKDQDITSYLDHFGREMILFSRHYSIFQQKSLSEWINQMKRPLLIL